MRRLALGWGASVRSSVELPATTPNSGRPDVESPATPRFAAHGPRSDPLLGDPDACRPVPDGPASTRASAGRRKGQSGPARRALDDSEVGVGRGRRLTDPSGAGWDARRPAGPAPPGRTG